MTEQSKNAEFASMLEDLINGSLSSDQHAQLNLYLHDRQLRQEYFDMMELEGSLASCYSDEVADQCQVGDADGLSGPQKKVLANGEQHSSKLWGLLALAACLVTIVFSSGHFFSNDNGALPVMAKSSLSKIATVTATRNCRWKGLTSSVGFGADLYVGDKIELLSGLAEISLERGGSIIVEGPAKLDLLETGELFLAEGHICASIPMEARGVLFKTTGFGVRDTGAEFGLFAQKGGRGEVHVFKGNVFADLFNVAGSTVDTLRLSSEEGARLISLDKGLNRIQASHDRFVRSLSPLAGPSEGLHLYEPFDYPAGPLAWQNGGFGWAGPWEDLETIEIDLPGVPLTNRVGAESLEISGMVSNGGRATQKGRRNRIRRVLSTSIGGVFEAAGLVENRDGELLVGRDNNQIYISFLQRVNKTDDGFYGVELNRGDGNRNRVLCIGNGAASAGYGATSEYNQYLKGNFPPLGAENTDINFFVLRIDYGVKDKDIALVYRNPQSLTEEDQCKVDAKLKGFFSFDRISLGNFGGEKIHEVDEIRVGTTFKSVTGHRDGLPQNLARQLTALKLTSDVSIAAGKFINSTFQIKPFAQCKMHCSNNSSSLQL